LEARLQISDVPALRKLIGEAANDDPKLECSYVLDIDELDAVAALSDSPFQPDRRLTTLTPWDSLRNVPYLIHTGFELPLMLDGRKPLAAFSDSVSWITQYLSRYDRFVEEGLFTRRILEPGDIREVYFAIPDQDWRIDAYVRLAENGCKNGGDDTHAAARRAIRIRRLAERLVDRESTISSFDLIERMDQTVVCIPAIEGRVRGSASGPVRDGLAVFASACPQTGS
jgi:hypothetical protein